MALTHCGKPSKQGPEAQASVWSKISDPAPPPKTLLSLGRVNPEKKLSLQEEEKPLQKSFNPSNASNTNLPASESTSGGAARVANLGGASVASDNFPAPSEGSSQANNPFGPNVASRYLAGANLPTAVGTTNPILVPGPTLQAPSPGDTGKNTPSAGGSLITRSPSALSGPPSVGGGSSGNTASTSPVSAPATAPSANFASNSSGPSISSPPLLAPSGTTSTGLPPLNFGNAPAGLTSPTLSQSLPVLSAPAQPMVLGTASSGQAQKVIPPSGTTTAVPPPPPPPAPEAKTENPEIPPVMAKQAEGGATVPTGNAQLNVYSGDGTTGEKGEVTLQLAAITPAHGAGIPGPGESLLEDGDDNPSPIEKPVLYVTVTDAKDPAADPCFPKVNVSGRLLGGNLTEGQLLTVVEPGIKRFIDTPIRDRSTVEYLFIQEKASPKGFAFSFSWSPGIYSWDPVSRLPLTWLVYLNPLRPPAMKATAPTNEDQPCIFSGEECFPAEARQDANMVALSYLKDPDQENTFLATTPLERTAPLYSTTTTSSSTFSSLTTLRLSSPTNVDDAFAKITTSSKCLVRSLFDSLSK